MKKLITIGLLGAALALAGTAFAERGDGTLLKGCDLHEWSTQSPQPTESAAQAAGPGAQPKSPVRPASEYRGSEIK